MLTLRIGQQTAVAAMTKEELTLRVAKVSAAMKVVVGITNNAAYAACLEAIDHVRGHQNYRHAVKRAFNDALDEFKAYEHRLIYAEHNRLFRLDDLTPEYRKRYGNITDREYYEFWCATGASAYTQKHQWVTNLWNKFRLSLIGHKVPGEDIVAWPMAADACLLLAVAVHENWTRIGVEDYGIPEILMKEIFGQLSLGTVEKKWAKALTILEPLTDSYELSRTEQKNIQMGVDQLQEEWTSLATIRGGLNEAIEAYDDVFRTKGEQKKALRQIADMRE